YGSTGFSVFELNPAGLLTTLFTFGAQATGEDLQAGVIRDPSGNLYGTASVGGPANQGALYKVDPSGNETVYDAFTGATNGSVPVGPLARDAAGNLYGITALGGNSNWGLVFKIDPSGNETVLYSFTGEADGGLPVAGLARDSAGNLYG